MIQVARMLLETRGKRSEVNKLMLDKYWGRFLFLNGKKKKACVAARESIDNARIASLSQYHWNVKERTTLTQGRGM